MTKRQIEKLLRTHVISRLLGWEAVGRGIYLSTPNDILCGVYLEQSGFEARSIYPTALAIPLYVPTSYIYFRFGRRLKDSNNWEQWPVDVEYPDTFVKELSDALRSQGLTWLAQFTSPELMIEYIDRQPRPLDIHLLRTKAYSFAYLRQLERAIPLLNELIAEGNAMCDKSPWAKTLAQEAELLLQVIGEGPDAVGQKMSGWIDETRTKLKLLPRDSE